MSEKIVRVDSHLFEEDPDFLRINGGSIEKKSTETRSPPSVTTSIDNLSIPNEIMIIDEEENPPEILPEKEDINNLL